MSLGSVLSSHDRCVTYNVSNLIMVRRCYTHNKKRTDTDHHFVKT